ncbi:MAG TPA: hypothetical protein VJQ57_12545 [Acidimicrobiia bacterium]|nr:hypothetical protein [Acidimicrobiia bacterium]
MSRKRLTVLAGVAVLFLLAGTSFALSGEWDFVSGYDDENDVLVYGLSEVTSTTGAGGTATGCAALDGTTQSYDSGTTTTTDASGAEVCELRIVDVANENGVVNHGQVVSSFVQDLKEWGVEGGIGCLVRSIAGSDFGKGEEGTDVTVPEVTTTTVLSGEVDLTLETVNCGRPEHAGSEAEGDEPGGRPDHAGRPEHAGPPDHAQGGGNDGD